MKIRVDIKENALLMRDRKLLQILLKDKSTKKNIIWASDEYSLLGEGYAFCDEIKEESITGCFGNVIKPRTQKSKSEQNVRIKEKAEVFTPAWVCNKQNNLVDSAWFNRESVFNYETDMGWITIEEQIVFPGGIGKTWQDYVAANRLEISCGEAPYLASRYDTVTGTMIPVKDRIGLLDRKLRVVSENTVSEEDWILWATKAVQSIYGYDWQGDNVLLARENILYTFAEHYEDKYSKRIDSEVLIEIAKIIVWNIWQMDGLKMVVPNSCHKEESYQLTLFGDVPVHECPGCEYGRNNEHNGIYCRIMDWKSRKSLRFIDLMSGGTSDE